jgi:hypothetical protein
MTPVARRVGGNDQYRCAAGSYVDSDLDRAGPVSEPALAQPNGGTEHE